VENLGQRSRKEDHIGMAAWPQVGMADHNYEAVIVTRQTGERLWSNGSKKKE
jgi:hypothetical protein